MGTQCNGTTKNGERCKISGTFENGYCHLHKDQFMTETPTFETTANAIPPQTPSSIPDQQAPKTPDSPKMCNQPEKPNCRPSSIIPMMLLTVFVLFLLFKFLHITNRKTDV